MILRIQTLYLFLIFALGTTLFIENPIVNEIHFRIGNQTQMEFTQYWCYAEIGTGSAIPLWKTNVFHAVLLLMVSISSIVAIFFPRNPRLQFGLSFISFFFSGFLLSRLLIQFRIRLHQLDHAVINALETPHLLWFGLLFALQISVLRYLWPDVRRIKRS